MTEVTSPQNESSPEQTYRRRHERVATRGQVRACIKEPFEPENDGHLTVTACERAPRSL